MTAALALHGSTDSGDVVVRARLAAGHAAGDVDIPDAWGGDDVHFDGHELIRLAGDHRRLEIHGVPSSRLQEGSMKLMSGPATKGQVTHVQVPLGSHVKTIADVLKVEQALCELVTRTSRAAFEHVRSSLHRLDMAHELIASGCSELQLTAAPLVGVCARSKARTLLTAGVK